MAKFEKIFPDPYFLRKGTDIVNESTAKILVQKVYFMDQRESEFFDGERSSLCCHYS